MNEQMLLSILNTQSETGNTSKMVKNVAYWAKEFGGQVRVEDHNIYVTKGNAPVYPCYVAHTDTVHKILPKNQYQVMRIGQTYFGWDPVHEEFTGIGGDDKVGIVIALTMLQRMPAVKLAFFRDEEVGALGAEAADMRFFDDVGMALEADRRGYGDMVTSISGTELCGSDFIATAMPYLSNYNFRPTTGMLTDVYQLKLNGLGVSTANFSCGYYDPHTSYERINMDDVHATMELMYDLGRNLGQDYWSHVAPPPKVFKVSTGIYRGWKTYGMVRAEEEEAAKVCDTCCRDAYTEFDKDEERWWCEACFAHFS